MNIATDNAVEVHHETSIITKITSHRTDIVLHHEIEIIITEALLKIIHVPDKITINEILNPIVLLIDLTDHLTDAVLVLDTDHSRDNNFKRYTSSFRPPSRPRDSRYSRTCSHSNKRYKDNTVQAQSTNYPFKVEVHMYHPTEMANTLTPTSWFCSLYLHTSERYNKSDYPSRLDFFFLLDSGASISVLNYPNYNTIEKLPNMTNDNTTLKFSKTLTVANQTEDPLLHYKTLIKVL